MQCCYSKRDSHSLFALSSVHRRVPLWCSKMAQAQISLLEEFIVQSSEEILAVTPKQKKKTAGKPRKKHKRVYVSLATIKQLKVPWKYTKKRKNGLYSVRQTIICPKVPRVKLVRLDEKEILQGKSEAPQPKVQKIYEGGPLEIQKFAEDSISFPTPARKFVEDSIFPTPSTDSETEKPEESPDFLLDDLIQKYGIEDNLPPDFDFPTDIEVDTEDEDGFMDLGRCLNARQLDTPNPGPEDTGYETEADLDVLDLCIDPDDYIPLPT